MTNENGFFRRMLGNRTPRPTYGEKVVKRSGMQLEEGEEASGMAERITRISKFITLVNGEIFETKLEEFKKDFLAASREERSALVLAATSVAQGYRDLKAKEAAKAKDLSFVLEPYASRAEALEQWAQGSAET